MSEAEEIVFDEEEWPTRQSGVVARGYARETEALLACGGDPGDAQMLLDTIRPRTSPVALAEDDTRLDAIVQLAVSSEELAWFPLGNESAAIAGAVDGRSTLRAVLERAGVSSSEGIPHVG